MQDNKDKPAAEPEKARELEALPGIRFYHPVENSPLLEVEYEHRRMTPQECIGRLQTNIDRQAKQLAAKNKALQKIANWRKHELYKEDIGEIANRALKGK